VAQELLQQAAQQPTDAAVAEAADPVERDAPREQPAKQRGKAGGRVSRIRKRADRLFDETFRAVFEEIDIEKLKKELEELRRSKPDFEPREHARLLARRTALRCAAAGAMTGFPSGILAFATLGADLAYLIYQQFRLILGIATIYGYEPSQRERFQEALACIAYGSGAGIGKQGVAAMIGALGATEGTILVEKIGMRIVRDRLARFVPFLGAVSAGAVNYAVVMAVSRTTIRYYEARVDPEVADEIWAEGDREHA
jgi:hypothetical protein